MKLTDEQVEKEIARLTGSANVHLARREHQIRYRRRKYLSQLQALERRGAALREAGIDEETLEGMDIDNLDALDL